MTIPQFNLTSFNINGPFTFENLSLFSIKSNNINTTAYKCWGDSTVENIEIKEKQDETVEFIFVTNHNNFPIFILDGSEFQGAMQNRIIDYSIIIPGNAKEFEIPVSCVERSRWRYGQARDFVRSDNMVFHTARHSKMDEINQHKKASQGKIWDSIDKKSQLTV